MHHLLVKKRKQEIFLLLPLVVTFIFWLVIKINNPEVFSWRIIFRYLSQIVALVGYILLCLSFVLATRAEFIEKIFGGLDQVYFKHGLVSKLGFLLVVLHPILLIFFGLGDGEYVKSLFIPFYDSQAKTLAIIGLLLFTVLILITIFRFLPYHIWSATHKLMGIPMILVSLHAFWAESDIKYNSILKYWILFWAILSISLYFYQVLIYPQFGKFLRYRIKDKNKIGNIDELYFEPMDERISFEPGEFVFLSFPKNEWVGPELHPFTISSSIAKDVLRISYKEVGDYTHNLKHVKKGDQVKIFGPYGEFSSFNFRKYKKQIWIAGGIGITPFLSMFNYERSNEEVKEIDLFYCVRNKEEAVYEKEFKQEIINSDDKVKYTTYVSSESGRLSAKKIIDNLKIEDLDEYLILMCGPVKMMQSLKEQFLKHGADPDMIVFEEFDFV